MRRVRSRPVIAVAAFLTLSITAACVPPAPPTAQDWSFKADEVTAVVGNDPFIRPPLLGCGLFEGFTQNCFDEAYTITIWFRAQVGVPNSAQTGVVSTRQHAVSLCAQNRPTCSGNPTTRSLNNNQGGLVNFPEVRRYDIGDLAANPDAPLEIVGTWVWAMEEDLAGTLNAGPIANIMRDVLNQTIGEGNLPSDVGDLVQLLIDNLGQALLLGGSALLNALTSILFGIGDDVLGSRIYVGVGAKGTLGSIVNSAVPDLDGFNTNLAIVGIPNVLGVNVRALTGTQRFIDQMFNQDGRHDYDFRFFRS